MFSPVSPGSGKRNKEGRRALLFAVRARGRKWKKLDSVISLRQMDAADDTAVFTWVKRGPKRWTAQGFRGTLQVREAPGRSPSRGHQRGWLAPDAVGPERGMFRTLPQI